MDCDGFEYLATVHRADRELRFGSDIRRLKVVLRRLEQLCSSHALIPLLRARIIELQAGAVPHSGSQPVTPWPVAWSVNPPTYIQH